MIKNVLLKKNLRINFVLSFGGLNTWLDQPMKRHFILASIINVNQNSCL